MRTKKTMRMPRMATVRKLLRSPMVGASHRALAQARAASTKLRAVLYAEEEQC